MKYLVEEKADGNVQEVFREYHRWDQEGRKVPLSEYKRIRLLDVLRGFAIIGTLGTNIWLFAQPVIVAILLHITIRLYIEYKGKVVLTGSM